MRYNIPNFHGSPGFSKYSRAYGVNLQLDVSGVPPVYGAFCVPFIGAFLKFLFATHKKCKAQRPKFIPVFCDEESRRHVIRCATEKCKFDIVGVDFGPFTIGILKFIGKELICKYVKRAVRSSEDTCLTTTKLARTHHSRTCQDYRARITDKQGEYVIKVKVIEKSTVQTYTQRFPQF